MRRSSLEPVAWLPVACLLWASLLGASLLGAASCKSDKAEERCAPIHTIEVPADALSKELMASLGQAQNFHSKADVLIDNGELEQAAATLAMIFEIPFPKDAPEAEDVMADTRARLGKLDIELGKLDEGLALVDEGIATSTRPSFYLANLHTVRGQILQAKANAEAEAGGDPEAVKSARVEAIKALDQSIQINEALLNNAVP